jgi:hypothetical protein
MYSRICIRGWMYILRSRGRRYLSAIRLGIAQQLQPLSNGWVVGIQLSRARIGINGVGNLVVAAFIEAAKIKPYFRDVRIDADGARICI